MFRFGLTLIVVFALIPVAIAAQPCNTIDAVTSASFRITGGQACATTASLDWRFPESNGTLVIKWGTSTSYGSTKSVYASNPIQLAGLTPATTYYYAVDGIYSGRNYQYVRASFVTAGNTPVNQPPVITSAAAVGKKLIVSIGHVPVEIPLCGEKEITVALYSLAGAQIMNQTVPIGSDNGSARIFLPGIESGLYLIKIATRSSVITRKAVF